MSLTFALAFAAAAPFADLGAIDRKVARFTGAAIGEPGGARMPVDRRLRLRSCAADLYVAWHTARKDTVLVRCTDTGGWRLFVPVQQRPRVQAEAALPVIRRGDPLTIMVEGTGFSVSRHGEALEAGPAGAWIRVRPVNGRRHGQDTLRARIVRPGIVSLPLK